MSNIDRERLYLVICMSTLPVERKGQRQWNRIVGVLLGVASLFLPLMNSVALASPHQYLGYQGRLADQNGNLLTGNYTIGFCIYTTSSPATACAPSGTTPGAIGTLNSALWGEIQSFSASNTPANSLVNGVFNAKLGAQSAFPGTLFSANSQLWIGVLIYKTVGSAWDTQMAPLQEIVSSGYSIASGGLAVGSATDVGSVTPSANQIPVLDGSGNLTLPSGGTLYVGGGSGLTATSTAVTAPGALSLVSTGGSNALTLTGGNGKLTLGASTNTITNTDATTQLTINPTGTLLLNPASGNVNFYSSSNSITSAGNLTLAGALAAGSNITTSSGNISTTSGAISTGNGNINTTKGNFSTTLGNVTSNELVSPTTAPTLTSSGSGGNLSSGNYYAQYSWTTFDGETLASSESTVFNIASGTTNTLIVTLPVSIPSNAVQANIYVSNSGSNQEKLQGNITSGTVYNLTATFNSGGAGTPGRNNSGGAVVGNFLQLAVDGSNQKGIQLQSPSGAALSPYIGFFFGGTLSRAIQTDSSNNLVIQNASGSVVDTFANSGSFTSIGNDNIFSSAVNAGANYGTVNIGSGGFAGGGTNFAGSSSGTLLALNAPSGYSGNLVDLQVGGASNFNIDASGNLNLAGSISSTSGITGNVNFNSNVSLSSGGNLTGNTLTAASTAPTLNTASASGGNLSNGTYYVVYTWLTANGETTPSSESSITLSLNGTAQSFHVVVPTFPTSVIDAKIYISTTTGTERYQYTTATTTSTMSVALSTTNVVVPIVNGAGGTFLGNQVLGGGNNGFAANTNIGSTSLNPAGTFVVVKTMDVTLTQQSDVLLSYQGSIYTGFPGTGTIEYRLYRYLVAITTLSGGWGEQTASQQSTSGTYIDHNLAAGTWRYSLEMESTLATATVTGALYFDAVVI